MTAPDCVKMPSVVPWIALREGELGPRIGELGLRPDGRGLCYLEPREDDRDDRGVLWARCSHSVEGGQPVGRPDFTSMHPQRQYTCMGVLRCQVHVRCPASRTRDGYLFILPTAHVEDAGRPEGMLTNQPPLCLTHAEVSVRQCPELRKEYVALRSRVPRLYGVDGTLYGQRGGQVVELGAPPEPVPYTNRQLTPWILASQLVRRLTRVTVIDLEDELRTAAAPRTDSLEGTFSR